MTPRLRKSLAAALAGSACALSASLAACGRIGTTKPAETAVVSLPQAALAKYAQNCSACHGADGVNGAARPLADANYLASVGRESIIAITTSGVRGGFCPGSGPGSLANWDSKQVAAFVDGLMEAWGKGGVALSIPWSVKSASSGDASRGRGVYAAMCQSCHGAPGSQSASSAGSVTDPNYLRLITDQGLRSAIIFGRPARGMPAWSGPFPNQPADRKLSAQEVSDVTAFLRSTTSLKSQEQP
ncbi:MAG: cytochrome c [Planctomycetes bacterium]|nr:cytochrome c [Planctomycetota bacterium]